VVKLPIVDCGETNDLQATPQDEAAGTAVSPSAASKRVLIVEDNAEAAETLAEILRLWGHDVRVAGDGLEAVGAAQSHRAEVVLLDIGLPGQDGYTVARHLRELPELRESFVVALTGYGQEAERLRSREAGFDDHLVKPVDLLELERLLSQAPHAPR
jgi:CheY-like chemotaxis protein